MKNLFFLSTIIFLTTTSIRCEESYILFDQANKLYKAGKFKEAMQTYKKIQNKSAYTNYNLGNCAYKLKQYGFALLYWRRAEKDWGLWGREELLHNIHLLKEKIGTQSTQNKFITSIVKIKSYCLSLLRSMPLIFLQLLFLIVWLFLFVYIKFLYKRRKKYIISLLFALIALFGILLAIRYSIDARRYGIVVNKQAHLLSGPHESYRTMMNLSEGEEVIIKRESDGFYKIKVLRQIGWVSKKSIETI